MMTGPGPHGGAAHPQRAGRRSVEESRREVSDRIGAQLAAGRERSLSLAGALKMAAIARGAEPTQARRENDTLYFAPYGFAHKRTLLSGADVIERAKLGLRGRT